MDLRINDQTRYTSFSDVSIIFHERDSFRLNSVNCASGTKIFAGKLKSVSAMYKMEQDLLVRFALKGLRRLDLDGRKSGMAPARDDGVRASFKTKQRIVLSQKAGILHAKGMPTITIKKFPEALLGQLRDRAAAARRSVTQEVLATLENSFAASEPTAAINYPESARQAEAWAGLSGKWQSDLTVQEEIDQLYKTRRNRKAVDL